MVHSGQRPIVAQATAARSQRCYPANNRSWSWRKTSHGNRYTGREFRTDTAHHQWCDRWAGRWRGLRHHDVGSQSDIVGWLVHLLISAFIGGTFGVIASRLPAGWPGALIGGIVWGVVWWGLGALIIMPLALGMNEMVLQIGQMQINSLIGHIIFGAIMGAVYRLLAQRS